MSAHDPLPVVSRETLAASTDNVAFHKRSPSQGVPAIKLVQDALSDSSHIRSISSSDMIARPTTPSKPSSAPRRTTAFLTRTPTAQNGQDKGSAAKLPSPPPPQQTTHGLDPLSNQIFLRTNSNTEPSIAQRFLNTGRPDSPNPELSNKQSLDTPSGLLGTSPEVNRRKAPSFLSRLSIRGGWKKEDDMQDSDSELGELRSDGYSTRALTTVMGGGGGFIPLHKEPPRYIRVKPHHKKTRNFNRMFLAQELQGARTSSGNESPWQAPPTPTTASRPLKGEGAAIWAAEFSLDGQYLAVAGQDQVVRIFAVLSSPEDRQEYEDAEELSGTAGEKLSAPVFRSKPVKEFRGHTGDVLALCWSKNNFLLSSSMDKTVRLWHMSRDESLCTFAHNDLVTSVAFHPTDDRFFLAGSLDAQLRLWSIPEQQVAFSATTSEFITAVAFSPDGKVAICGLLSGLCNFYHTDGLKLDFQIHVRSSRGKNAKGSKITGIRTYTMPASELKGGQKGSNEVRVLITSNDSRVRVYNLKDRMLEIKLKGLENQSSQIHARFSDDARFMISGSEDRKTYLWSLDDIDVELKDKQPYECFDAHTEVVTNALIAPAKTKRLLSTSGDPLFDLCNPPPVQLLGLDEQERGSGKSVASSGDKTDKLTTPIAKKPEESPAYIERSHHPEGHIIVTTDRNGSIKVFRRDCAYVKRQQSLWETGSRFSGKLGGVRRSGSVITKTSGGSRIHSRRGSLNLGQPVPPQQPASDRIMSWRQDVAGDRSSMVSVLSGKERSASPMKLPQSPLNGSAATLASDARKLHYVGSPTPRSSLPTSPTGSVRGLAHKSNHEKDKENVDERVVPPIPSFSLISATESEHREERSDGFWSLSLPRWKGLPSLRYPNLGGTATSSNAAAGSDQLSNSRKSSDGLKPSSSAVGRRSFAAGEAKRSKEEDIKANRRKSMGPRLPTALKTTPNETGEDERASSEDMAERPNGRTRMDSGVGKMSLESTSGKVE